MKPGRVKLLTIQHPGGIVARSTERVLVAARLPASLARQLKVTAAKRGTTVQALLEEAVRLLLAQRKEA